MNHDTRRPARPDHGAPAPLRHLVTLNEETHLRLVCFAGLILSHSGRDYANAYHEAAAHIMSACLDAGTLTPDVDHEEPEPTGPSSARVSSAGANTVAITADPEQDAAFLRLARAHGLTWSQAFSFAASWIIPPRVVQDFKEGDE